MEPQAVDIFEDQLSDQVDRPKWLVRIQAILKGFPNPFVEVIFMEPQAVDIFEDQLSDQVTGRKGRRKMAGSSGPIGLFHVHLILKSPSFFFIAKFWGGEPLKTKSYDARTCKPPKAPNWVRGIFGDLLMVAIMGLCGLATSVLQGTLAFRSLQAP